ncbi:MAG: GNAT family N-acetyltransferase [Anaeromicrobium sp.]|jgi:ribosomal protein S18 acetylase RimI-like enzyme|uniref:GNAT family N-acetyltransferase n=1 Tax=Anaeromicrobium sp. TaxID=1929132 RepID=UPI0025CBE6C4|nr:GNAT family N-acetyltransferase [Anaeromicrobium sp.]MCT4595883.1 GNAT family N-acetyltransferase [Anaeromicrobium sp.]
MNFKIREGINSDYIDISNISIEVHNLHLENRPDVFRDVNNLLLKEYFEDLLNSNDKKLFVVENMDNKELVAYCIIRIVTTQSISILISRSIAYVDEFCVKSNYKKNGIGRLLFKYIIDYAKTEGATSLQLVVWEFNKDAIKFYETMGMSTRNRKIELNL